MEPMTRPSEPESEITPATYPVRQPGWAVLVAIVGGACLFIGVILMAMLQAPSVRQRVILTACAFLLAGIVLLPIAWMKRARRPSPSAADERAHEADNQPIPPT